jgi:hypothetical protein
MSRILFERTGGLMGRKVSLDLDLDELPPDQARTLSLLLEQADFFNLPANLVSPAARDAFIYTLTLEAEAQVQTIRFGDATVPDALRPLLEDLSQRARTRRV